MAYLVSVIPVVFLMMALAMLGSALPTTGGNYKYASRRALLRRGIDLQQLACTKEEDF